jgi:hypothetical protein
MLTSLYRICALSSLFWSLSVLAEERVLPPKKLFLSIGISSYSDKRWPSLAFSGKDADDLSSALRANFYEGQLLSDQDRKSSVRKADILLALSQLQQQNVSEDDTVIVYLSTHGTLAQGLEGGTRSIQKYLVAQDTVYDQINETGLAFRDLLNRFQSLKSRRKALIIDSCYSGVGKAHITPAMLAFMSKQKSGALQQPVDSIDEMTGVYTASAWGEEAHEDPKLNNGVYTHFLLKSFESDLNGDGAVQLSEAHQAASNAVIEFTRGAQHPTAQVEIVGRDPIVLHGKATHQVSPSLLTWRWEMRQYLVKFKGKTFGTLGKGIVSIPEGEGILELIDPKNESVVASRRVELMENEVYSVEQFLFEQESNRLLLGASVTSFVSRDTQKKVSRDALNWLELGYIRDDLLGPFDLSLSLAYLPSTSGRTSIVESLGGQNLGLQNESQKLSGWKVDFKLLRPYRIDSWTSFDRHWITRAFIGFGGSTLQLDRNFTDMHGTKGASESATSAGVLGETGLEMRSQAYRFLSQLKAQLAAYDNQFTKSSQPISMWGLSLSLGMYW